MATDANHVSDFIRSCDKDTPDPRPGNLSGNIPSWLEGSLYRNGPGLFKVGETRYKHLFDGLSVMHRFDVRPGGKVTYQNRFLESDSYRKNMEAHRIVVSEFGTNGFRDPCATIFDRFKSTFVLTKEFTDNASINFMKIGDGLYVATETNYIRRVDPKTLETKEKVDLNKIVSVNTCTAHPHYGSDQSLINIGSSYSGRPSYIFVEFPNNGEKSVEQGRVICRLPSTRLLYPSYYHSFGMTENYIILVEQSLVLSVPRMVWATVAGTSFLNALRWSPEQPTRFQIVNRKTGEHLKTDLVAEPFMVFHHANAYETETGEIVLDLCAFEDKGIVDSLLLENLYEQGAGDKSSHPFRKGFNTLRNKLLRFVLPLTEATQQQVTSGANLVKLPGSQATATLRRDGSTLCTPEYLSKGLLAFEMPQYNYNEYNTKKYKYVYGIAKERGTNKLGLAKVDTEKKSHVMWVHPEKSPSEPVFVAKPGGTEEDDGVLLASLLDDEEPKNVSLLVLDAKNMKELARVDFQAAGTVPSDFHGQFYNL